MAILIPSKNIYEMNNPKIRDNVIDNLSVEQNVVKPNNEYETSVFNIGIDNTFQEGVLKKKYDQEIKSTDVTLIWGASKSYVELKSSYLKDYYIEFDDFGKTSIIDKVYYGKKNEDENYIKYSLVCNKKKYNVSVSDIEQISDNEVKLVDYVETLVEDIDGYQKLPSPEIKIGSSQQVNPYASSYAEIIETNLTNISTLEIAHDTMNKKYKLNVTILVGLETLALTGIKGNGASALDVQKVACSGEKIIYTPKKVELTIYGDTIGIDLTDGSVTYGSGKKPHSLSGNELLQDSSKTNGIALTEHLANNILNQYAKGKETATLLCSISDYYGYTNATLKSVKGFTKRNNKFYQASSLTQEEIISSSSEIAKYVNAYITEINYTTKNVYIRTLANLEAIEQNLEELIVSFNFYPYNIDGGYISEIIIDTSSNETLFFITFNTNESFEEFTNKYSENSVVLDFISQVNLRYNPPEDANFGFRIDVLDKNYIIRKTLFAENEIQSPIEKTLIFNAYENYSYIRILPFFGNYEHSSNGVIYDISEERDTKIVFEFYLLNNNNLEIEFEVKGLDEKNTAKIISTQKDNLPMSFRLHDEVIPYVFGANGQDAPMSKNQNGTAKIFEVIGSNIIYDGAVWQELTLLEKK